jgi:hypothetical protein
LRTSLLVVIFTFGMLACSNTKVSKPVAKVPAKDVVNAATIEKAPKPSPYIYKAPRQVSVVNREPVASRRDRPQSE